MRKLRKKAQKLINKKVRMMNKGLLEDDLWRGRFYLHQVRADWEMFDDLSGGILTCWIEIRDKKTGRYKTFRIDNYGVGWALFSEVNNFIIYSGVWDNITAVKMDKTNWEKVIWKPKKEVL